MAKDVEGNGPDLIPFVSLERPLSYRDFNSGSPEQGAGILTTRLRRLVVMTVQVDCVNRNHVLILERSEKGVTCLLWNVR